MIQWIQWTQLKQIPLTLILLILTLLGLTGVSQLTLNPPISFAENQQSEDPIRVPDDRASIKLTLDQEGIYEVSGADLFAAGLSSATKPSEIQLMQYGKAVAYQLINDNGDDQLDSNEKIRFYGWSFDESRSEKLFVTDNVFWLITGETATTISPSPSVTTGPEVRQVNTTQRFEVDDAFSSIRLQEDSWSSQGAEPDHFFWLELARTAGTTEISKTLSYALTHPVNTASSNATISAQIVSRNEDIFFYGTGNHGQLEMVHESGASASELFPVGKVFTVTQSMPNQDLNHLENQMTFSNRVPDSYSSAQIANFSANAYVNTVQVTYLQSLTAVENEIGFDYSGLGSTQFLIDGLSAASAEDLIAWEIGDRHTPQEITPIFTSGGGIDRTYQIGFGLTSEHRFFVTGVENIRSPNGITLYQPSTLEPTDGDAAWLAISHATFMDDAERLADHRAEFSNLSTFVADVDDVAAQFGYGFKSSHAIKRYIQHGYDSWATPLAYVTLIGDAHFNPRHLPCTQCLKFPDANFFDFGITTESFVPVNHSYADDIQGLISSDYDYSLLAGDDLIPEIGIGRLAVESAAESKNAVDKIIIYEDNLKSEAAWQKELLFLHDLSKTNEPFETQSLEAGQDVPSGINVTVDGLKTGDDADALRSRTFNTLANGVGILMWRGHGGVDTWSDSAHRVLSYDDIAGLDPRIVNDNKPFVSISFDCLDGHFALPGYNSLSESLLRMDRGRGAAAHFSSSGLGFISDHAVLSETMINGIYTRGLTTIGDAINYTKYVYLDSVTDRSELYSFNLLGDPAMALYLTPLSNFSSDASVSATQTLAAGEPVSIQYTFENGALLAASSQTMLKITLPSDTSLTNLTSSVLAADTSVTSSINAEGETEVVLRFNNGAIPAAGGGIFANDTVTVDLDLTVNQDPVEPFGTVRAELSSPGNTPQTSAHIVTFGNTNLTFMPYVPEQ